MNRYRVTYWEDEFNCVCEVEIDAEDEKGLKTKVDEYAKTNLDIESLAGAKWRKIEMIMQV